jgi:hypothetical protein
MRSLLILSSILAAAACAAQHVPLLDAELPRSDNCRLLVHASEPHDYIKGAEVVAIAQDGSIVRLGSTNGLGVLTVPKQTIRSLNPSFLIVCHEWYFCGAIRMDEEKLEIFDARHIELARWVIH